VSVFRRYGARLGRMQRRAIPIAIFGRADCTLCLLIGPYGARLDFLEPLAGKAPFLGKGLRTKQPSRLRLHRQLPAFVTTKIDYGTFNS